MSGTANKHARVPTKIARFLLLSLMDMQLHINELVTNKPIFAHTDTDYQDRQSDDSVEELSECHAP